MVRWTGVRIQVWGKPFTGVPAAHEHLPPLPVSSILYGDQLAWRASVWHGGALPQWVNPMLDYTEIYNKQAGKYDLLISREDYQGNIFGTLNRVRPLDGLDVVELGAGTGRLTGMMAPAARTILACDGSQPMLDVAVAKLKKSEWRNWRVVVADNRRLPVADQAADLSIAGWSLGHSTSWYAEEWRAEIEQALAQMKRVLRPGGTAIVLETLGTGWENPRPPTDALAAYYALLEEEHGFSATWMRTDYRFASSSEAEDLTRFFFGDGLADRVAREDLVIVPECTGMWWLMI
jgi:ubiquinone/menaquinone biosynthesis C-methylase UbiE